MTGFMKQKKIIAIRIHYAVKQWLIQRENLGEGTETWEPLDNLPGHDGVIQEFEVRSEREQAELARKRKEKKEGKRKERDATEGGSVAESGFEQATGENLRSAYWRHFNVRYERRKLVEYACTLCGPDATPKEYCGKTRST
ncbi:hypothetical protein CYMTET_10773 [Cymbomonas tetramitiformis]|uniref:Chromo domain-containing protein n=1 Tax=Cymbomonas tetramitiformis TaxID=36881 RepID=A0AAE0GP37_9CHLO|nr:hypothetical protein CYMTET_10773 [Cymbomonas tetramitiformis]